MFDLTFIRSVRTAKNIRKTWNTDIIIVCQNFIGLILKPISYFFGVYMAWFFLSKICSLDHDLMSSI